MSSQRIFMHTKIALLAIGLIAQTALPALSAESEWQNVANEPLGQSEWTAPAGTANVQAAPAVSDWTAPAGTVQPAPAAPPYNSYGNAGYQQPTNLNGLKARSSAAAIVPEAIAGDSSPMLQGSVDVSNSFPQQSTSAPSDMSSLGNGNLESDQSSAGQFQDISEANPSPLPGVNGQGTGIEQMISNMMMVPMMMAASSGMMGARFHTYGPGGGISYGRRVTNPAAYYARRAAIRALRQLR